MVSRCGDTMIFQIECPIWEDPYRHADHICDLYRMNRGVGSWYSSQTRFAIGSLGYGGSRYRR